MSPTAAGWETASWADRDDVHVIPLADLVAHDDSDECVCGPTTEPAKRDDGSMGWLVVHHALDGRQ